MEKTITTRTNSRLPFDGDFWTKFEGGRRSEKTSMVKGLCEKRTNLQTNRCHCSIQLCIYGVYSIDPEHTRTKIRFLFGSRTHIFKRDKM